MAGYTRQSTFTDGDIINASDSNDEFNQLINAFSNTTGHAHDGTAAEGPVIGLIGDPGVATPKNKVVVDDTNNQIEVSIDVSGTSTEQFIVKDGVIEPTTDDDIDLGSSTKKFKDAYVDGIAYLDAINFNGTAISATAAELNIMDGVTATTVELNIMDGVTATTAELNIMDGVTAATAELNIMDGVTATTAELNIMDGVTATTTEINLLDGVTSTTAELNIVDGSTTATSTTVAAADRVVLNDNGTMVQAAVTDLDTFFSGTTKTLTNKTLTSPVISTISNTGTITLPTSTDTLVGRATTDTLTNKTFDANGTGNSLSNVEVADLAASAVVTESEGIGSNDNDTTLPTSAAVKDYVDSQVETKDALSELSGDSDDITEGTTNLFFTNERVDDRVDSLLTAGTNITLTYDDTAGTLTVDATDTGITDVVSDTSPQLGGDLDVNTNNISFGDSTTAGTDDTLMFGAGDDLKLYHDGTHSYIHDSGTGDLRLRGSVLSLRSENDNVPFVTASSSGVTLTHAGATKLTTVSSGVDVTGSLDVTDASTTRTNLGLGTAATSASTDFVAVTGDDVTGNINFADNAKAQFGAGNDLQIYHNGSASYISDTGTGDLNIQGTNVALRESDGTYFFYGDSSTGVVSLRHNGNTKLATTSTGVTVTGTLAATAVTGDGSGLTNLPASGDGGIAMAIALG